jgi:hypothetical protein
MPILQSSGEVNPYIMGRMMDVEYLSATTPPQQIPTHAPRLGAVAEVVDVDVESEGEVGHGEMEEGDVHQ